MCIYIYIYIYIPLPHDPSSQSPLPVGGKATKRVRKNDTALISSHPYRNPLVPWWVGSPERVPRTPKEEGRQT